jgi:hypothetical protein
VYEKCLLSYPPMSAALSHRDPALFMETIKRNEYWVICVYTIDFTLCLVPRVIVTRAYAVIDLVNVFRTHGTIFDSRFGFRVLGRFITFSLS